MGTYQAGDNRFYIVSQYADNGSLKDFALSQSGESKLQLVCKARSFISYAKLRVSVSIAI